MEKKVKLPTQKQAEALAQEWADLQLTLSKAKAKKAELEERLAAFVVANEVDEVGCVKAYTRKSPPSLVMPPSKRCELAVATLLEQLDDVYLSHKLNAKEISLNYKLDAGLRSALRKVGVSVAPVKESLHFKYIQKS